MANITLAIDTQLDQINFLNSEAGHRVWNALIKQQVSPIPGRDGRHLFVEALSYSPSYFVERDMVAFIQHATSQLETDSICPSISELDLLTNSGFVYFEVPIEHMTFAARGLEPIDFPIRGFSWTISDYVLIKDDVSGEMKPSRGIALGLYIDSKHVPEADLFRKAGHSIPQVIIVDESAWSFMLPWSEISWDEYWEGPETSVGTGRINPEHAHLRRFLYTFFHLISARIHTVKMPRKAARRAERQFKANPPPNYGDIRVITLRRSTTRASIPDDFNEEEGREWSHRWMVSGHWRNQWYKKEQVHRPIWIEPYVKGPEDKPLIIKDTLYDVKR